MPLLGGLFSRKDKASPRSKRDAQAASVHSTVASDLYSNLSSPTASYVVQPDRSTPSSANARNRLHPDVSASHVYAPTTPSAPPTSSSNRLRLPFGRKKSTILGSDVATSRSPSVTAEPSNVSSQSICTSRASTSTSPEEDRRLRPPPSRSAIFAAYTDSNGAMSTRSLPNESTLTVQNTSTSPPPSTNSTKRPSIFPWSKSPSTSPRSHLKYATSPPASAADEDTAGDESFNLKSFRHVRPRSPTHSNASNISLSTPIPRTRGTSVNSESSQRISVAVFREVQARRSLAGSPSPSLRSPSPAPALPHTPGMVTGRNSPRPSRSSPHISQTQARRRSSIAIEYTSDSDGDSSAETDSEDETINQRSATQRANRRSGKGRAMSEMGHGQSSTRQPEPLVSTRAPKSHLGHSFTRTSQVPLKGAPEPKLNQSNLPSHSQSNLSQYGGGFRQRATASTSALSPSPAAKRASILVSENAGLGNLLHDNNSSVGKLQDSSPTALSNAERTKANTAFNRTQTNATRVPNTRLDSDSDSEDDAPLASLVGPRRPGSSMSSYSNAHSRSAGNVSTRSNTHTQQRPLIDIRELTGTQRTPSTLAEKSMAGFTNGPTLLSDGKPHTPLAESPLSTSMWPPTSVSPEPLTSIVPPVKFISPPGSPAKELKHLTDSKDPGGGDVGNASNSAMQRTPSPERRRDLLTDRLTRAVTRNISPATDGRSSSSNSRSSGKNSATNPSSSEASSSCRQPVNGAVAVAQNGTPSAKLVFDKQSIQINPSPPDQDLAQLLGAAAKFISLNGESPSSESEGEDSCLSESDSKTSDNKDRIAPIPIKQRSPPPAFAVTSRPPFPKHNASNSTQITEANEPPVRPRPRPRSVTLVPPSSSFGASASPTTYSQSPTHSNGNGTAASPVGHSTAGIPKSGRADLSKPSGVRQRSSTMLTSGPLSVPQLKPFPTTEKPFVTTRRNSPASSTGDSSSGRAPLTPRDGSDIGLNEGRNRDERSGGASGLNVKNHVKRRSVSFEDSLQNAKMATLGQVRGADSPRASIGNIHRSNEEDREERRRERRRSEAKAAIELGNVINGRGPIVADDDDADLPVNQTPNSRTSMFNPMMPMGGPMQMTMGFGPRANSPGWGPNMQQPMLSPAQFMMPPPETQFLAAHQRAMMIAKHAYQMAVAQQAMAAAGDEWERGSAIGGFSGSVYGGSTNPPMANPPFGMVGSMMQGPSGWPNGSSVYLPSSSQSMYGGGSSFGVAEGPIGSSRSEYGGINASSSANWSSSKSSYGEAFGPSPDQYSRKGLQGYRRTGNGQRDSGYLPPVPPIPASQGQSGRVSPDGRALPRPRTGSQPSSPNRGPVTLRRAPPPSSWKASS